MKTFVIKDLTLYELSYKVFEEKTKLLDREYKGKLED